MDYLENKTKQYYTVARHLNLLEKLMTITKEGHYYSSHKY